MTASFALLSILILSGAILAMTLRNLVHCALALTLTFAGLAGVYLQLNAQFIGFAQVLVYIGAVAILVVFAILLTRGSEPPTQQVFSGSWAWGAAVALVVFGVIAGVIFSSRLISGKALQASQPSVRQIGDALMTRFILPLEVLGLLLTAALIGGVIIALKDKPDVEASDLAPTTSQGFSHTETK
jgi:NADH-quinone oxidoreductase subunit J